MSAINQPLKLHFSGHGDEWHKKRLGDLGMIYRGLTGKTALDFGAGSPFVTYKQIFDSAVIDKTKFGFVRIDKTEKQNRAKFGDIFFTASSETPYEVGFASVLLDETEELYLNSFCFGYRINSFNEFSPYFAQYLFRTSHFRKQVVRLAQGSTRFNLPGKELMKVEINLPSISEQKRIADYLMSIDEKINLTEQELERAKLFKKALLQQMFV